MSYMIHLVYTEALLGKVAWRRYVRLVVFAKLGALTVTFGILFGLTLAFGDWEYQLLVGYPFVLLFALLFSSYRVYRQAMRGFFVRAQQGVTCVISDEAFSLETDQIVTTMKWPFVKELEQAEDWWTLSLANTTMLILPLENLPPDARTFVLDRVRASGGKLVKA